MVPILATAILLGQIHQVGGVQWVHHIDTQKQFDDFARVGTVPYKMPHLRFTIDRKDGKIYYYNSKIDMHHRQMANATYLSLDSHATFFRNNYLSPNRRFILGWLAFHPPLKKWTFEFWEGDLISREQIVSVRDKLAKTFFQKTFYKPNSIRQEEVSTIKGLARVMPDEIHKGKSYEAVNLGRSVGRLRILTTVEGVEIMPDDIVVIPETPISLPPVAGIVFGRQTTPLSHLSLMARQWQIPSAYVRDGDSVLRSLEGKMVVFDARKSDYTIRAASAEEIKNHAASLAASRKEMNPRSDLFVRRLADLTDQLASSVVAFGAKSANLGEVARAKISRVVVPKGFTIPFAFYSEYMKGSGADASLRTLLADSRFKSEPVYRREKLKELRETVQKGAMNATLRAAVLDKVRKEYKGKGLFVRSSTNSEDLKNFSGAGLYTTVPNVVGEEPLIEAIKTVWASVWNDEAFAARERAGIPHLKVYMAVLIQEGVNAESAGVMVTANPFNPGEKGVVYISAKRGLGIKVVEGQRVPEQLIWRPRAVQVQVLTRSAEESLLTFDASGGVKEVPIDRGRAVLTDAMVRRLTAAGLAIQKLFKGSPQDIEWIVVGSQIYIVQSRPFLSGL